MSIVVDHITKMYGSQKALDDVSFSTQKGEIVGLLGPNGAGKSTLMKILTCYIPATSGSAVVSGLDVREKSIEVRKKIGYLPENNPLYYEMHVKEFLNFIAGVYKIPNRKNIIDEMVEMTGLVPEMHKKIGALSKGYKQRVGLAQALMHKPEVLILDEPTSGLDPNQIIEIRDLIKSVGKQKTVLLSTHIMQEVEAICNHVIIIDRGKIVANDKTKNLSKYLNSNTLLTVEFDKLVKKNIFEGIEGIKNVRAEGDTKFVIEVANSVDIRKEIFDLAVKSNVAVLSMNVESLSIEEVFHRLTKH